MDRFDFPKPLVRVTAGPGGEAVLALCKEKTVLHDCGMACFHEELINNIEKALDGRDLDYIVLSHSHYDHMGALPYLIERWPNVLVCGGKKSKEVFLRQGAQNTILSMGKSAAQLYGKDPEQVHVDGIRIDIVLNDGDVLKLGENESITAIETKGHTDCSMTYLLKPYGILLLSESTGIVEETGNMHTSVLKSFEQTFDAAAKLKKLDFQYILVPHYGILDPEKNDTYFDTYIYEAKREKNLIEGWIKQGLSLNEIFEEHKKVYWNAVRAENHPYRAYKMNTEIIIKRMIAEQQN